MINQSTLEQAYRHWTRKRIALALIKVGHPMEQAAFLGQFKKGDLDDAVHCGLVRRDVAGITLTEGLGRKIGERELAAEQLSEAVDNTIRTVFSALSQRVARSGKPRDRSRELR